MSRTREPKVRLAYLVSHPIQYQVPLIHLVANHPDIELTVFYCTDFSARSFHDPGFNQQIRWDVPLLSGYRYHVLPAWGNREGVSFACPINYGLLKRLKAGRFDALWIHGYARWISWTAMAVARLLGIKVLIRDEANAVSTPRGPVKTLLKRMFFQLANAGCDGFLAIGGLNRAYYLQNGIPPSKIHRVPYAVDNLAFQAPPVESNRRTEKLRTDLGLQKNRPVILYVGKLIHRKRPQDLLRAYIQLFSATGKEPAADLLFIGDGGMRGQLTKMASETGWDTIRFLSFQNQSALPSFYQLGDIFVLPSAYEPWGLVVNEAMNGGCAVLLSDRVGCGPDLLHPERNGLVYKAGDINALAGALGRLVADPNRTRQMGQESLEIINPWNHHAALHGLVAALDKTFPHKRLTRHHE